MLTKLYPMVQFKKDTWEIDEFDCASMFLLIGTEKAMLIDCGMGIGDLRGAVEMLTDIDQSEAHEPMWRTFLDKLQQSAKLIRKKKSNVAPDATPEATPEAAPDTVPEEA